MFYNCLHLLRSRQKNKKETVHSFLYKLMNYFASDVLVKVKAYMEFNFLYLKLFESPLFSPDPLLGQEDYYHPDLR